MPCKINITGQKFGLLTAIKESEKRSKKGIFWICLCECGRINLVATGTLRNGGAKSCGVCKPGGYKYGESTLRIKRIWNLMMWRCYKESSNRFHIYGARGIEVCSEWHDYFKFKKWALENGYDNTLSIDRINNWGNYEPNNCRWASNLQQARNRRNTAYTFFDGSRIPISELAANYGMKYSKLFKRLKLGWNVYKALDLIS